MVCISSQAGIVKDLEKTLDGVSNDVELLNNRCTHLTDESKKLQQEVESVLSVSVVWLLSFTVSVAVIPQVSELASGLEAQEKEVVSIVLSMWL